ncbi:MAG: flagellar motor switch protein FliN [Pseudomonadota bacterium]
MSDDSENNEAADAAEDDPWAEAMQEQGDAEAAGEVPTVGGGVASDEETAEDIAPVAQEDQPKAAELDSLSSSVAVMGSDVNMDVILDLPLTISMEIGRTKITVRNLLQLNQGSVVELDRMAGEHLDVMVNGTLVAHGEVVVANEKFGIRLTDVISPVERIKNLRP